MVEKSLLFFRNEPEIFNLGDLLCTPMYYFDFHSKCIEGSDRKLFDHVDTIIFGGGAHNNFGQVFNFPYEKTIAWGIGSSVGGINSTPPKAIKLPYKIYGIRDPDSVIDERNLIPCVSCMHPLLSIKPGKDTSIFINIDPQVAINTNRLKNIKNSPITYTNAMSELSFIKAFKKTGNVITNSYHIAYWSFLSGRNVSVFGYSSKFRSLFKLLGLDPKCVNYFNKPMNFEEIIPNIEEIINTSDFINLKNYQEVKSFYIEKNVQFARLCVELGLFPDFSLHKMTFMDIIRRDVKSRWKDSYMQNQYRFFRQKLWMRGNY